MDLQIIQDCYAELEALRVQSHGTPNIARRIGEVMEKLQAFTNAPKCALVEMPEPNASEKTLSDMFAPNPSEKIILAEPAALVAEPVEDKKGKRK